MSFHTKVEILGKERELYTEARLSLYHFPMMNKIRDAWKRLNQEWLFDKHFHSTFIKTALNLARMVPLMYSYDDNQSLPGIERKVKSLLYDDFL